MGHRRYWHPVIGYNYAMSNLQAAVGLGQLERIDELLARKEAIIARAESEISASDLSELNSEMAKINFEMSDTIKALKSNKIAYVGAGRNAAEAADPVIISKKGYRVGYLAYTMIVPGCSKAGANSPGTNAVGKGFSGEMKIEIVPAWVKSGRPVPSYDTRLISKITAISRGFGTKFEAGKYSLSVTLP